MWHGTGATWIVGHFVGQFVTQPTCQQTDALYNLN